MFITKEKYDELISEINNLRAQLEISEHYQQDSITIKYNLMCSIENYLNTNKKLAEEVTKLKQDNAILSALLKLTTKEN